MLQGGGPLLQSGVPRFVAPPGLLFVQKDIKHLQTLTCLLENDITTFCVFAGLILPRYDIGQPPPMVAQPPPVGNQPPPMVSQPPHLAGGLPPRFPNFDISQPPPGLRPPFQQMNKQHSQNIGLDDMDIDHVSFLLVYIVDSTHRLFKMDYFVSNRTIRRIPFSLTMIAMTETESVISTEAMTETGS